MGKSIDALPTRVPQQPELVHVVVETSGDSGNKLAYDEESGLMRLKKVLPRGHTFPFCFGFIPHTKGGDGDPLDVLLLLDDPVPPGTLVRARLLGVIEAEQQEKDREPERNDRILATADCSKVHEDAHDIGDLPERLLDEIELFFQSFHALDDKQWRPVARKSKRAADALVTRSMTSKQEKRRAKKARRKKSRAAT